MASPAPRIATGASPLHGSGRESKLPWMAAMIGWFPVRMLAGVNGRLQLIRDRH